MHPVELLAEAQLCGVFLVELFDFVFLPCERFNHPDTAEVFLEVGGQDCALFLVGFIGLGEPFEEENGDHQDNWDDDD